MNSLFPELEEDFASKKTRKRLESKRKEKPTHATYDAKPPESDCETMRQALLMELRRDYDSGAEGVSGIRLREICPQSMTQRISEIRKRLEETEGLTVHCEKCGRGSLYRIGEVL